MDSTRRWILMIGTAVLFGCSAREGDVARTVEKDSAVRDTVAKDSVVRGTVAYRERVALPDSATVEIRLLDISRQDVVAEVIAETTLMTGGKQVPIPFELPYDATRIHPRHSYAVRATIHAEGQMLFTTDTVHQVITGGHPVEVDLMLKHVPSH